MTKLSQRQLAKAISQLENNEPDTVSQVMQLPLSDSNCHIIGITGPPGAGKSTLCNHLLAGLAQQGAVAALLVDPSSPFSGGAILGDRIRLNTLAQNPHIYVRSLSNRGNPGGVSRWIVTIIRLLLSQGFRYVVVETVGAGQSEVKIASIADTTVVVAVPQLGDDIQTAKSGMMEVADVFVVNKADLPGSGKTAKLLREIAAASGRAWKPPVCETIANRGAGCSQLLETLAKHHQHLRQSNGLEAKRRLAARFELVELSGWLLHQHLEQLLDHDSARWLTSGEVDIYRKLQAAYSAFIKSLGEVK